MNVAPSATPATSEAAAAAPAIAVIPPAGQKAPEPAAAKTEPTPPAAAAVPEAKDEAKMGARFAALSKKEAELREKATAAKTDKEEAARLRSEADAIRAENEEFKALVALGKKNPQKILEKYGITYAELTQHILNPPKEEPVDVKAVVASELAKEREADEKKRKGEQIAFENARIKEGVEHFSGEIDKFVDANPEEYELILVHDAKPMVMDIIERYFNDTGEVLEPKVAADYLENHLLAESKKIASAKKLAPAPQKDPALKDKPKDVRDTPKPSPTLTNAGVSASGTASSTESLSDVDRFARAVSTLKFTK